MGKSVLFGCFLFYLGINLLEQIVNMLGFFCVCVADEACEEESKVGEVMEGVASIALLPCGSISGHFIQVIDSTNICYGLHGTGTSFVFS